MPPRTYSAAEILIVSKATYYRLEYLIRMGKVVPLNRGSGRERRFSEAEAVIAVSLLNPSKKSILEELEKLADA